MSVHSKQPRRLALALDRNPTLRHALLALLAAFVGVAGGAAVAFGPPWAAFAALLALACGYALLVNTSVGLAAVVLIATILPFGTLPFKAIITPNFLELALLALLGVWLLRLLTRPEEPLVLTPLGLPIIGFLGLTLFSLILGSRGSPDTLTLHNYVKFVLAVLFFFGVVNCVRTRGQARWLLWVLVLGGVISALLGVLLYALSDDLALRLLVSLGRIGYPTGGRVLRFVEDDPSGVERAIGLSVDPNSYGGMLALIGALVAVQAVAERPLLPRPLVAGAALLMALTVYLTQSRGALGGLLVGVGYAAVLRYRRLWWGVGAAAALAALLFGVLGLGGHFVERVSEGLQFRDQANQMRLAEYRNALAVIQAYPVFGIGFGRAPELDLVAGVSSIYLALAQRVGLTGLAVFLGTLAAFFAHGWRALRAASQAGDDERAGWLVGLQSAVAAALAVGLLDHYFFNIEFSHMVALFWGCLGLAVALGDVGVGGYEQND